MRIHREDCDVSMPTADDILLDLGQVSDDLRQKFIPLGYEALSLTWVRLVQISDVLGEILRAHYRVVGPRPVLDDIEQLAEHLERYALRNEMRESSSDCPRVYAYQVELLFQ